MTYVFCAKQAEYLDLDQVYVFNVHMEEHHELDLLFVPIVLLGE